MLQRDACQAYTTLTEITRADGPLQLVYCWTHIRRRLGKRVGSNGSSIAEEMLP